MQTCTFLSVRQQASVLLSATVTATVADAAALDRRIAARYVEFFELFYWPEVTLMQRRTFRASYAAASTYVALDEVYDPASRGYYVALRAVPANQLPATGSNGSYTTNVAYWAAAQGSYAGDEWSSARAYVAGDQVYLPSTDTYYQCHTAHTNQTPPNATYWGALTEFVRSIDYSGGNQGTSATALGEVKAIWDGNRRINAQAERVAFDLADSNVIVRGADAVVWVEFRRRPNDFTGNTWASGSFAVDAQVYYPTTGEFYRCLAAATSELPTDTAKWVKLDFPLWLRASVAQAAFADTLKIQGKTSKWVEEMREARRLLQREFDKVERMQGQTEQMNVMTR